MFRYCVGWLIMLDWLSCNAQGPQSAWTPPPLQWTLQSLSSSPLCEGSRTQKSVVAIFRINTLTPMLIVGSDVYQVYRPRRETGELGRGGFLDVGVQSVHCGNAWRSTQSLNEQISSWLTVLWLDETVNGEILRCWLTPLNFVSTLFMLHWPALFIAAQSLVVLAQCFTSNEL